MMLFCLSISFFRFVLLVCTCEAAVTPVDSCLFDAVHPDAGALWRVPLHGSGFTKRHPGRLKMLICFYEENVLYYLLYTS